MKVNETVKLLESGAAQEELDAIYYDNAAYVYFRQKEA